MVLSGKELQISVNNRVTMPWILQSVRRISTESGAEQALERAKERLRQKESLKEYKQTEASLSRALMRLKVTGRDL